MGHSSYLIPKDLKRYYRFWSTCQQLRYSRLVDETSLKGKFSLQYYTESRFRAIYWSFLVFTRKQAASIFVSDGWLTIRRLWKCCLVPSTLLTISFYLRIFVWRMKNIYLIWCSTECLNIRWWFSGICSKQIQKLGRRGQQKEILFL